MGLPDGEEIMTL